MADDLLKDLITHLPSQAVLPATILAAGLSVADKVPKLLAGLGSFSGAARVKRELEIYKLRYEIAALKKQHELDDLGEGTLLRSAVTASRPLNARGRFASGAGGAVLGWVTVITLLPKAMLVVFLREPIVWVVLALGAFLGGLVAVRVRVSSRRRLLGMSIGAATVTIILALIYLWACVYFTYYSTPPCGKDC